ncbi:MAG: 50S ribosomal protein L25 [Candidatus Uhrbacteria bacterium]|nr:50S ribosomal protein L25 [Candidatus Uhrbacteria bacterium]
MDQKSIQATPRELAGRKTDALRAEGKVPAVMYGFETEPINIELDRNQLDKLYTSAGYSTVINLTIGDALHNVLIAEIQRDPLTDFITHADFRRIDMNKKIEATIAIVTIGVAPAVKEAGGTLVTPIEEVEVLALPTALVREIQVDISGLKTFEDTIHVRDLIIPEGIEVLTDLGRTVALVQAPRKEEDLDALNTAVVADVGSVEVTKEKKEGAEGVAEKSEK